MSDLDSKINEAISYHQSGDLVNAKKCYTKILKKQPDNYDAMHMLGVLSYQQGKYDKAIALLEKTIKQNATAEALTNLATVFIAKEDLHKARDTFIQALKLKPELALTHYNLGNTYKGLRDFKQAIISYKKALEINPQYYDVLHNLAIVYKAANMFNEAKQVGLQAISIKPNNAEAQFNLAGVLQRLGNQKAAINAYTKTVKLDPDNQTALHLLSALTGDTTERPPDKYIADLFDDFAEAFDDQLVNKLKYRTPQIIYNSVVSQIDVQATYNMLDLGCGTGLCGKLLVEHASFLAGVDLSSKMIDKAKALNVYHDLCVNDIESYLDSSEKTFDVIISADVFVYVGALESVFNKCKKAMSKGGVFVFSVEEYNEPGFKLLDTGRYAHSTEYIREIAKASGFREVSHQSLVLREQDNKPINGCVFVLES